MRIEVASVGVVMQLEPPLPSSFARPRAIGTLQSEELRQPVQLLERLIEPNGAHDPPLQWARASWHCPAQWGNPGRDPLRSREIPPIDPPVGSFGVRKNHPIEGP